MPPWSTIIDSGPVPGSVDYTTLVLIHGFTWHAPVFERLLPLAAAHNVRIVAPARYDYPGSASYSATERERLARLLKASPESKDAFADAHDVALDRAREVHDFLCDLVRREPSLPRRADGGGIVLVGWSMGTLWATAFLAYAPDIVAETSESEGSALGGRAAPDLSSYVRRVVLYDGIAGFFGFEDPEGTYSPTRDQSLSGAERFDAFDAWVGGYYDHGERIGLETRAATPVASSLPGLTPEQRAACTCRTPWGEQGEGSDMGMIILWAVHGISGLTKERAFYLEPDAHRSGWEEVEVRVVWCDRSIWPSAWAGKRLEEELAAAREDGKAMRKVQVARFRGANHMAHWDMPERALSAFLGDGEEA
ncbi:uncharacterized protein BXZ73DRAFT_45795 [Epithele typhae]|uniref:uncharacterized protein n=1 Tax=Epithele typhae TaxID=378194 RepID=UPI0020082BD8|nr:uncharacterized protein BXZ73DRAFT_45795 [Epithele typhae]KAH9934518.1 hypothetical protein BXZ73DRAFT_45795 [Epithele typhae]